jgi:hypothetical protein
MWDSLNSLKAFSKLASWCAVILAFVAGSVGLFTLINFFEKGATLLSVILAFISGIFGLLALIADKRKDVLELQFRKTSPELNVSIKTGEESNRLLVVIEPLNKVPFEYDWCIVTENNIMVTSIHLEWGKIIPNESSTFFTTPASIDMAKVTNNYLELRFKYRSVHAAEFPQENLFGKIVKPYTLTPDKKFCLPLQS